MNQSLLEPSYESEEPSFPYTFEEYLYSLPSQGGIQQSEWQTSSIQKYEANLTAVSAEERNNVTARLEKQLSRQNASSLVLPVL